jgi:hypothetical protein
VHPSDYAHCAITGQMAFDVLRGAPSDTEGLLDALLTRAPIDGC